MVQLEGGNDGPRMMFCPNLECPCRGMQGKGNIRSHGLKEGRYRCTRCGKTFSQTKGTPHYRLHKSKELFNVAMSLMSHGCPVKAIVETFDVDERTLASWILKAGAHVQAVQEYLVEQGKIDLLHVQADELYVRMVPPTQVDHGQAGDGQPPPAEAVEAASPVRESAEVVCGLEPCSPEVCSLEPCSPEVCSLEVCSLGSS